MWVGGWMRGSGGGAQAAIPPPPSPRTLNPGPLCLCRAAGSGPCFFEIQNTTLNAVMRPVVVALWSLTMARNL